VLRPDVVQIAEDLAWYLDEPFGDTSAIPTYMVSKLAAEHVTVVLTGDGGDELFGGYDKYVTEGRERGFSRVPRPIRKLAGAVGQAMPDGMKGRRFLRHMALDGAERYLDASMMFRADELRKLFQPDAYAHVSRHDPRAHALSHLGGIGGDWMSADSVLRHPELSAARHPDQGRSDVDGAFDRGAAAAARSQAGRVRGPDSRRV
jgi:asparagine synthase (glutamine-hydrolysing)